MPPPLNILTFLHSSSFPPSFPFSFLSVLSSLHQSMSNCCIFLHYCIHPLLHHLSVILHCILIPPSYTTSPFMSPSSLSITMSLIHPSTPPHLSSIPTFPISFTILLPPIMRSLHPLLLSSCIFIFSLLSDNELSAQQRTRLSPPLSVSGNLSPCSLKPPV